MIRALQAEFSKLKRSRMILWTALVIIGYTSIGLATFPVIEDLMANPPDATWDTDANPYYAAEITEINWDSAMKFVPMGVSGAWGIMLLSLVTAYVFGRDLREGTDVASATLPVRRELFVLAKLIVVAVWAAALAVLAVAAAVACDAVYLSLDTFEWRFVLRALLQTLYAMVPIFLTLPVVAWLSMTRKGYLRPMLFALAAFVIASGMIGLDVAAYFPWSMPIVLVGVTWMPLAGDLTAASWAIALGVFAAGLYGILRRASRAALAV